MKRWMNLMATQSPLSYDESRDIPRDLTRDLPRDWWLKSQNEIINESI